MKCPECKTSNPDGQNFCGLCGCKLKESSASDKTTHDSHAKFCGACGSSLTGIGDISLARSGLITQINKDALNMIGYTQSEMQGKPFSLFVESADLVIFYSFLNELLSSGKRQSFEITLKHKNKNKIFIRLECNADQQLPQAIEVIHLFLTEITDTRLAADKMQAQQELLGLIFSITNNISTVNKEHLSYSIEDALKKICLFTKADRSFIYGFNRPSFRLDPLYEWRKPLESMPEVKVKSKSVDLSRLKGIMKRLRQEKTLVVHNTATLKPSERDELSHLSHAEIGALIYHAIYLEKFPIGVIGVAKKQVDDEWSPNSVELITFFGDFIASRLPSSETNSKKAVKAPTRHVRYEKPEKKIHASTSGNDVDISDIEPGFNEQPLEVIIQPVEPSGQPSRKDKMVLAKFSGKEVLDEQKVFQRGDGLVLLTCSECGIQESVSLDQFDTLGNAIHVTCPCSKQFVAVLEKRRFYRKTVHLDGFFSLGAELGAIGESGNIWGPIVVKDLSKAGIQFSTPKANLIKLDDILMVRFNLDNVNHSLIHKPAKVITVSKNEVGCQFEGEDSYDITLGFYFM